MYKLFSKTIMFLFFYFIFGQPIAYAEGMKVKSGLWETTSIVTLPFGSGTQEHVSQDCINESQFTAEQLMANSEGCTILDSDFDSNSMQWKISCNNGGVEMFGEGNAKSTKTSITGEMSIKATVNGQEMTMLTNWKGSYIGEC